MIDGTHLIEEGMRDDCILYVPKGRVDFYRGADGWTDFSNGKEIDIKTSRKCAEILPWS